MQPAHVRYSGACGRWRIAYALRHRDGNSVSHRLDASYGLALLRGEPASLNGLDEFFSDIDRVNRAFFARLNHAVQRDAGINALLSLQAHSELASMSLKPEIEIFPRLVSAVAGERSG